MYKNSLYTVCDAQDIYNYSIRKKYKSFLNQFNNFGSLLVLDLPNFSSYISYKIKSV